jgi:uncharacterized protein (DUF2336 family)
MVNHVFTGLAQVATGGASGWRKECGVNVGDQAGRVLELARFRTSAGRERLLIAIADLCASADAAGALDDRAVSALLSDIFLQLVSEAERDIRRILAEKLAYAAWAPPALINVLALDEIEIARPVIASSPVLADHDLVRILIKATLEHQVAVASRPELPAAVVDAVLQQGAPAVLTALAANPSARISASGLAQLVEAAREAPTLRAPLARHPRLDADNAQRLYLWVGQALRRSLLTRFRLDVDALDQALGQAVGQAYANPLERPGDEPDAPEPDFVREDMERRLIDKLHAAGQLRTGYLMRALKEQKLSLFQLALAKLGGFTVGEVRQATGAARLELIALACVAVGLDRSVFPNVLDMIRGLNGARPLGPIESGLRVMDAFAPHPPKRAAAAFRRAASV